MAKVSSTLSISSTDVLSSNLSLIVNSSIDADSGNLSRAKVLKTAVHNDALVVYKSNDKLEAAYLYVKNMDAEKNKYIYLYQDTDNDDVFAKIGGGEFAFLPVAIDKTIKVYATRIDTMVEYAVFGLDSSAVTLS
tara:strand:- start:206 stop:610 length:405 start_codon:yes stop_codon:yes gene_type:complete